MDLFEGIYEENGFQRKLYKTHDGVCVSKLLLAYSILVNTEPKVMIRQRNPLSQYIFLLCTEGLHGLISQEVALGNIRGFSLCKNGPRLTNLLFADYRLLFCRVTQQEC